MQAGLLSTYQSPTKNRNGVAWLLSALLVAFYVDLYFFDHLEVVARLLHLPSKWFVYGLLYSIGMVVGGSFMLRKHGNSRYHRLRTLTLIGVQIILAFSLPLVLKITGNPELYLSYLWPLSIDKLFPGTLKDLPLYAVVWFVGAALVGLPALVYFKGKRAYCSWICGCGGLAETFGDPWRHLSDKSNRAWKFEQVSVHAVLGLALLTTGFMIADAAGATGSGSLHQVAETSRTWYGFAIGSLFSGVIGVGFYPLMGTRVWCRFGCPMAAMLGLIQKLGRFRISVKKDMCISCGNCSTYCEMGIDVRAYAMANLDFKRASCVGCGMCAHVCPRGVLKLETKVDGGPQGSIGVWTLDL
jgi:ferredoxin-type protein NapH